LKIIITSGGTSERIDDVRMITNRSTGKLGSLIADAFRGAAPDAEIIYVCSKTAVLPETPCDIIKIESAGELLQTLEKLLAAEKIDAVIHAMAVSDYTVKAVMPAGSAEQKKISSDHDNLTILLEKTPKVIGLIKQLQPETILVGFKLLSGVDEQTLLQAAHDLMIRNNCDFVLANDLSGIKSDCHEAVLIKPGASYVRLGSKQGIAEAIVKSVLAKIRS